MKSLGLAVLAIPLCFSLAQGQTPQEKKATIAYLQALQTKEGGFLAMKVTPQNEKTNLPSLRATAAALRALKYFAGTVPDNRAAIKFVFRCALPRMGGFSDRPGNPRPDPITSAVGLMALVELKLATDNETLVKRIIEYLDANASSFEEIRMAAAGLETVQKKSTRAGAWIDQIARMHNEKGTFGKGTAIARDTGGSVVAILRLGGKVANRAVVLNALKEGQRKDGGFGKGDSEGSDLETCYRVVRAFVMLKEKPADVPALRKFVARCRNADGGYGIGPGKPSTVGSTYFASIVLHWLADK